MTLSTIVKEERPSSQGEASVVEQRATDTTKAGGSTDRDEPRHWWRTAWNLTRWVAPWIMATVAVAAGYLAVQRALVLVEWEATFTGSGRFVVSSCEEHDQWGPDQWHCPGRLTTGLGRAAQPSIMVVSRGAIPSIRPYVGQQWDVFFAEPDPAEPSSDGAEPAFVYADHLQLSEITRLYISIFPRVLLSLGAAGWALGSWYKRRSEIRPDTWWVRRLPGMSILQRRSAIWIMVAFVSYLIYRLIAYYLLGSVGVA